MWFHDSDDIYYSCKAEGVGLGYAGAAAHDGGKAIGGAGGSSVGLGVGGDASVQGPAFMLVLGKVLPAVVIWGAGTAIGEIPPYALAYAAAAAGEKSDEVMSIRSQGMKATDIVEKSKYYMLKVRTGLLRVHSVRGSVPAGRVHVSVNI